MKSARIYPLFPSLFLVAFSEAGPLESIGNGFWEEEEPGTYESFVRIQDGRGFKCVLDGKSSFRFQVIGDSITTPMNGMDAIRWYPGSGDLEISGEEKGVPYSDRFAPIDSSRYWAKCQAEEDAIKPLAVRPRLKAAAPWWGRPQLPDLLGRKAGREAPLAEFPDL